VARISTDLTISAATAGNTPDYYKVSLKARNFADGRQDVCLDAAWLFKCQHAPGPVQGLTRLFKAKGFDPRGLLKVTG